MEQNDFDLSTQLGITTEDAEFLRQVLNEVNVSEHADDGSIDITGVETNSDTLLTADTIIESVKDSSILNMIPQEDNDSTSRFSSAIWYEKIQQQTIILGGLGGIGRFGNLVNLL